jgi:hypothetical protein
MKLAIAAAYSLWFCCPAMAIPKPDLQQIKTCVAITVARGQASPPKSIILVGESKGFYLLRIGDRAGNPPYERIIKIQPCKTVYIDQAGETPSKYGIPRLPMEVVDDLVLQSVQYDIRTQGKEHYFRKIASGAQHGKLALTPEVYKALKKEGFKPNAQIVLFGSKK